MNTPVATDSVLHLTVPEVENNSATTFVRFSFRLLLFPFSFMSREF